MQEPNRTEFDNHAYSISTDDETDRHSNVGRAGDYSSDGGLSYGSDYSGSFYSDSGGYTSALTISDVELDFDDTDGRAGDSFHGSVDGVNLNDIDDIEERREAVTIQPTPEEPKPSYDWDVFEEGRQEKIPVDNWYGQKLYILLKLLFCGVLFVAGICSGVLSKTTLMVIVANINPPGPLQNNSLKTLNFNLIYPSQGTYIGWIWALCIIVIVPYIFALVSNIWRLIKTGIGKDNTKKKSLTRSKSRVTRSESNKRQPAGAAKGDMTKTTVLEKPRPGSWRWRYLFLVLLLEISSCVGLNMFLFTVLPSLEPVSGILISLNVTMFPAIIGMFMKDQNNTSNTWKRVMNSIGLVFAVASIILWIYHIIEQASQSSERTAFILLMIISPILISAGWWKSAFNPRKQKTKHLGKGKEKKEKGPFIKGRLYGLQKFIRGNEPRIEVICNIVNILITFSYVIFGFDFQCGDNIYCTRVLFRDVMNDARVLMTSGTSAFWRITLTTAAQPAGCSEFLPIYFAIINIFSAFVCFRCCSTACKILVKIPSYTLPMILVTPLSAIALAVYITQNTPTPGSDVCMFPFPLSMGRVDIDWHVIAAGLAGYLSILAITYHIWSPGEQRMLASRKIFSRTMYIGPLLDQSLLLNKTMDEPVKKSQEKEIHRKRSREEIDLMAADDPGHERSPGTTVIYMCATMWHESQTEMLQILLSILRMDRDQWKRWLNKKLTGDEKDFYQFEAHIFFDDAFIEIDGGRTINHYVQDLLECLSKAVKHLYNGKQGIETPDVVDTPYGGRIEWRLPGRNILTAHLKDPKKIRKKKRWSQVMYMYYFFAYKLRQENEGAKTQAKAAKNRFILALDGDVDFKPSAVQLLVDRMKKNQNVGAACGRIHPIGTGPMVWYQKFEYAVSHWLQKAAEHVTGCVLCSPGCFSLFRASALMDENVMKRYTAIPSEARHHIQYDQGEDRWLCTLLLQQGYRVEYCAASDALTYAPESFQEFYTQRRRWTPSTMANIIDLLLDWRHVTKQNRDISRLYIAYQVLLMVSSVLTPGTIFLMLIGAISMAYPTLSLYWSLLLNGIPLTAFIVINISSNNDTIKVTLAAIMSVAYALVMMLVVVGLLRQVFEYGICSVTTMFLCGVSGVFIIAAFLHPQEFLCLLHGFLYFLAIPSMSMLLMLYALCNLDNVSWGTRESVTVKPGNASRETVENKQEGGFQGLMQRINVLRRDGKSDYAFSFGNLCRCFCCPKSNLDSSDIKFEALLSRLDAIEKAVGTNNGIDSEHPSQEEEETAVPPESPKRFSKVAGFFVGASTFTGQQKEKQWMGDENLMNCKEKLMEGEEEAFWLQLIERYLSPYQMSEEKKLKDKQELTNLRNKVCLFFVLMNALFITIVFCLQQVNLESGGTVSIPLPCGTGRSGESVEPISIAFTLVFGILLAIQFFCMLSHRVSTFLHICSMTTFKQKRDVDVIREIQGNMEDDKMSRISKTTMGSSNDEMRLLRKRDRRLAKTLKGGNRITRSDSLTKQFCERLANTKKTDIENMAIDETAKKNLIVGRQKTIKTWKSISRKLLEKHGNTAGTSGEGYKGKSGFAAVVKIAMANQAKDQGETQQSGDQTTATEAGDKL